MRLSTWTATSTSVARRSSVCARNRSPITCFHRPMVASARARFVYPDAVCQAMRPCSAMCWRWRSRCVGSFSAVSLSTAVARGGTMTSASGWRSATLAYTRSWSYAPSPVKEATGPATWSSKGPAWEPSSTAWVVSVAATIWPVSASTPRCSLRHDRRVRVPCFSISHSPGPHSLSPVLSTNRCKGLASPPGLGAPARPWPGDLQGGGPAAQGGVVRHGEIEAKQAHEGADQLFGLPVRQTEHSPERQGRQDGELGIPGLATPGGARLSPPGCDCFFGEPDRQASTLAQAGVVGRPVRDLALLSRDVVAAVLVQLERHDRHPGAGKGALSYATQLLSTSQPIRAPRCCGG